MRVLPCFLLLAFATTAYAQAPPADSLTYDVVMQSENRGRLLNLATPEQKAAIVREQPTRWLAHNRASLSPDQISMVEEMIALIQASLYAGSLSAAQEEEIAAVQERALTLLTRDQVFLAFFGEAPYIPKP